MQIDILCTSMFTNFLSFLLLTSLLLTLLTFTLLLTDTAKALFQKHDLSSTSVAKD